MNCDKHDWYDASPCPGCKRENQNQISSHDHDENCDCAVCDDMRIRKTLANDSLTKRYEKDVIRTETPITADVIDRMSNPQTIRLLHAAMGLATEAGELLDMLKRHYFYGTDIDFGNAKEEGGDTMFYIGLLVSSIQSGIDELMKSNMAKRQIRYPNGFSKNHALVRDVELEKAVMTDGQCNYSQTILNQNKVERKELKLEIEDEAGPYTYWGPYMSLKGDDWIEFAKAVKSHIEDYVIPQYGDKGVDPYNNNTIGDFMKQIEKYAKRNGTGTQARPGEELRDFIKIAHCAQMAFTKLSVGKITDNNFE